VTHRRVVLLRQPEEGEPDTAPDELEQEARAAEDAVADESGYVPEPGLEGELPHPDSDELAAIAGGPDEPAALDTGVDPKPEKRIVIDLSKQTATALENGKPVKTMPISSGKPGHATTKGHFKITERDKDHKSSTYGKCVSKAGKRDVSKGAGSCKKGEKYEGAPMRWFQRFNGAEGLHQGVLPGTPASHGCVRLGESNAEWLWNWASEGTPVDVGPFGKPKAAPAPKKKP
jgi:lipoprotein-anchoring transpeptidase ErfK/SrfK